MTYTIIELPETLPMSARVRGKGITALLDRLGLPRMWDQKRNCWLVSRRSADELAAWLECNGRAVWVEELDL
jgi:hypothetical protein